MFCSLAKKEILDFLLLQNHITLALTVCLKWGSMDNIYIFNLHMLCVPCLWMWTLFVGSVAKYLFSKKIFRVFINLLFWGWFFLVFLLYSFISRNWISQRIFLSMFLYSMFYISIFFIYLEYQWKALSSICIQNKS